MCDLRVRSSCTCRYGAAKLRAGVVGLGKQAIEDHVPGLRCSDHADLVAVCDEDEEIVREQQYQHRVTGYTDFRDMFKRERLDFVVICVPHSVGRTVIEAAAEHRIHVLKEKPFATSLDEAHAIVRMCEDAQIELMVTLQRRFNPIYISFVQLAEQIGRPFLIDAQYTLYTDDPSQGWRGVAAQAGGGCIMDMGYHLVDMIIWYFGLPDRVVADISACARPDRDYDVEDTALIQIGYDSGLYGSLLLSRYVGPKTEQIRLIGSRGVVHLERGRVRRLNNNGDVIESLSREPAWPAAATSQVDYFCGVVKNGRQNISGPTDNLSHLRFIAACYQSARTHQCVNPKELA